MSQVACEYLKIVQSCLDWQLIEDRLGQFPNIRRAYTIERLHGEDGKLPYGCHYMAWAMMTEPDHVLSYWDCLLRCCTALRGWDKNRLQEGRFNRFWSDIWEMQVAAAFSALADRGAIRAVEWLRQGPDLKVQLANGTCYVEAYVYQEMYRAFLYLRWVLPRAVHAWIKVDSTPGLRMGLLDGPKVMQGDGPLATIIQRVFERLSGPWLARALEFARAEGRSDNLHLPCVRNLRVWLEDPHGESYRPDPDNAQPTCQDAVERCVREALSSKAHRNSLARNRPNVLLANFLPLEFYLGADYFDRTGEVPPAVETGAPIDGIWCFNHGVDRPVDLSAARRWHAGLGSPVGSPLEELAEAVGSHS
jgi:hypothetical protein